MIKYNFNEQEAKLPGVYCIKVNNHLYIGSTKRSVQERIRKHWWLLKNNKHYNKKLQSYFNANFDFEISVLKSSKDTNIYKIEQDFINIYNPDINIIKNVAKY